MTLRRGYLKLAVLFLVMIGTAVCHDNMDNESMRNDSLDPDPKDDNPFSRVSMARILAKQIFSNYPLPLATRKLQDMLVNMERRFLLTAEGICTRSEYCSKSNMENFISLLSQFTMTTTICINLSLDMRLEDPPKCYARKQFLCPAEVSRGRLGSGSDEDRRPYCEESVKVLNIVFGFPALLPYQRFGSTIVFSQENMLRRFAAFGLDVLAITENDDYFDVDKATEEMTMMSPNTATFNELFARQFLEELPRFIYPYVLKSRLVYETALLRQTVLKTFKDHYFKSVDHHPPEQMHFLMSVIDLGSPDIDEMVPSILLEGCSRNRVTKFNLRLHKSCGEVVSHIKEKAVEQLQLLGKSILLAEPEMIELQHIYDALTEEERAQRLRRYTEVFMNPGCDNNLLVEAKMFLIHNAASQLSCDPSLLEKKIVKRIDALGRDGKACIHKLSNTERINVIGELDGHAMTKLGVKGEKFGMENVPTPLRRDATILMREFDRQCFFRRGYCTDMMREVFLHSISYVSYAWVKCLGLERNGLDDDTVMKIKGTMRTSDEDMLSLFSTFESRDNACDQFVNVVSRAVPHIEQKRYIQNEGMFRTVSTFWSGVKAKASATNVGKNFDGAVSMQYAVFANSLLGALYGVEEYQASFSWRLWEYCSKLYADTYLTPEESVGFDKHIVVAYMDALRIGSVWDSVELPTIAKRYADMRAAGHPKDWLKVYIKVLDDCQHLWDEEFALFNRWKQRVLTICPDDGHVCLQAEMDKAKGVLYDDRCKCRGVDKKRLLCGFVVNNNDFVCHNYLNDKLHCDVGTYLLKKTATINAGGGDPYLQTFYDEFFSGDGGVVQSSKFLYIDDELTPL